MKGLAYVSGLVLALGLIASSQFTILLPLTSASAQVSTSRDAALFKRLSQSPKLQRIAKYVWATPSKDIPKSMQEQVLKEAKTLSQDEVFVVRKLMFRQNVAEYQQFPGLEAIMDQMDRRCLEIIVENSESKNFFSLNPEEMPKIGDIVETDPEMIELIKKELKLREKVRQKSHQSLK